MILLITYNKKSIFKDYTPLYNAIKSSKDWWHHLDNTWLISTNKSTQYWLELLSRHLTTDDRLLIVEIKPNYQGWLKKEAWNWLQSHFEAEGYIFS